MRPIDFAAAFVRDILLVIAPDGRLVDANPAALEAYGYSLEELLTLKIYDLRALDTVASVSAQMRQAEAGGIQFESVHRRKDGTLFPCEVSSQRAEILGQSVLVSVIRDLSVRRRTEEALRRSEESFRSLIERAPYGVLVHRHGQIVYANPWMLRYLGYAAADELVGRSAVDVAQPSERPAVRERIRNVEAHGESAHRDMRMLKRDGSEAIADVCGLYLEHFDGAPAVMAIFQDVTETRRLELELRQAQKMDAIGRLAGGVAHDFNNLLTAILGHSELLVQSLDGAPQRRHAEQIHRTAGRAAQLTSQLLAFSRKQVLQPKVIDLNATVSAMTALIRRLIGEDIELSMQLAPALWRVKADPGQLEQVLLNLALNARDAMPTGGELAVRTTNQYVTDGGPVAAGRWVVLEVADRGCGMDAETRARVFEPFFTTKKHGKGTGLGLSTVYGIVVQSGGKITVESAPGRGALFRVWLPECDGALSQPHAIPAVVERGSETILLVEDDADVRAFISDVLETHGYRVLQARDGVEAIGVIDAHPQPVALLLTDVIMPRMGGSEVAARLTRVRPALKVLYISGYPGETMVRDGALAPELTFLQKPFSVSDLTRRIREVLDA
jgi:PAS domain S-box-containing protein